MNAENILKANEKRTPSERRENARKAGIASGKARREKADLRKALATILDEPQKGNLTWADAICLSLVQIAADPKNKAAAVTAFSTIAKTLGQDAPVGDDDDNVITEFLQYLRGGHE